MRYNSVVHILGTIKGDIMISSYERNEMLDDNFASSIKEHERAYIENFKKGKVEPLIAKMSNCNLDLYYRLKNGFPDERNSQFIKREMEIKGSISKQKLEYQRLLNELTKVGVEFHTGAEMQNGIFDICKTLLDAAIKYDFPEQAIDTIKIMQDERIVGEENSKFVAVEPLKGVSRSYIKRYYNESTEKMERVDLKMAIRNVVNRALSGEFGDRSEMTEENLTPKEFQSVFKQIFREAADQQSKLNKTRA